MVATKMADQINTMLPVIMQQLKPLIARGNPLVERDYDALLPVMTASMNAYMEEFLAEGAKIYARHLTVDDMRKATAFFRSTTGQNFLRKQPEIMQESAAMGNRFGKMAARELQNRMTEELRKRGHKI